MKDISVYVRARNAANIVDTKYLVVANYCMFLLPDSRLMGITLSPADTLQVSFVYVPLFSW